MNYHISVIDYHLWNSILMFERCNRLPKHSNGYHISKCIFSWIGVIQLISNGSWNLLEPVSCFMDIFYNLYKYIWHLNNKNLHSYSISLKSTITFLLKLSNFYFFFVKPWLYFHIQKSFWALSYIHLKVILIWYNHTKVLPHLLVRNSS